MTTKRKNPVQARTLARRIAGFMADKQGLDIVALDLRKVADFTDYFIICTGVVDAHVRAIFDHVDEQAKELGWRPNHIEGRETWKWALIDYFDVVVHILQPDARGYYAIEKLWGDAPRIKIKGLND